MKKQELTSLFQSFNKLKILVIGDVMVDSYLFGKVNRISPEAPVPVVAVTKKENRLGGAANVALNIKAMGASPIICSVLGNDFYGKEFIQQLKKAGINDSGMVMSSKRITTVKTRVIGNNHQMLRVDEEQTNDLSKNDTEALLKKISALIQKEKPNAILFEDYDKGCITALLIEKVLKLAKQKNIPVVVDPKKNNFFNYTDVAFFKPNLKELQEGLKKDIDVSNKKELATAVAQLIKKINCKTAMITLSEHGVYIASSKKAETIPAHIRSIADVSGAGDTVISIAALCTALQLDTHTTAQLSNIAGGLVCEKVGVVSINKEELFTEAVRLLSK